MKTQIVSILFLLFPLFLCAQTTQPKTPEEVVTLIKKNVTCDWATQTVDNFKAGDPKTQLKGIAVCMFADMHTLKNAVKLGCNFIITHEPVFYNHLDETTNFENDPVYKEKAKYIKDNNLSFSISRPYSHDQTRWDFGGND
jgi:hypothetical protein